MQVVAFALEVLVLGLRRVVLVPCPCVLRSVLVAVRGVGRFHCLQGVPGVDGFGVRHCCPCYCLAVAFEGRGRTFNEGGDALLILVGDAGVGQQGDAVLAVGGAETVRVGDTKLAGCLGEFVGVGMVDVVAQMAGGVLDFRRGLLVDLLFVDVHIGRLAQLREARLALLRARLVGGSCGGVFAVDAVYFRLMILRRLVVRRFDLRRLCLPCLTAGVMLRVDLRDVLAPFRVCAGGLGGLLAGSGLVLRWFLVRAAIATATRTAGELAMIAGVFVFVEVGGFGAVTLG